MNFYADYIRNQLSSVIENMEHQSEKFVKNPGHDFTRNRKMNFISTINFLLTDRKSTRLNSSHANESRMPSSA